MSTSEDSSYDISNIQKLELAEDAIVSVVETAATLMEELADLDPSSLKGKSEALVQKIHSELEKTKILLAACIRSNEQGRGMPEPEFYADMQEFRLTHQALELIADQLAASQRKIQSITDGGTGSAGIVDG